MENMPFVKYTLNGEDFDFFPISKVEKNKPIGDFGTEGVKCSFIPGIGDSLLRSEETDSPTIGTYEVLSVTWDFSDRHPYNIMNKDATVPMRVEINLTKLGSMNS